MAGQDHCRSGGRRRFFASLVDDLLTFARAEFVLSEEQKDGKTLRWHLEVAHGSIAHLSESDQVQYIPQEIRSFWDMYVRPVTVPIELEYLWHWFLDLHHSRGNNGMGPAVITFQDMQAWMQVTGRKPERFELDAIRALDRLYLESLNVKNISE
ncbi:phage tail assembly chaperone [Undibacterium sp. TJN19]|uniref:phage tail assembly chaperone n=1 Tax=Undibacterium sp. TJN19 TaxID=3413055 RepID=UPI003BEFC4A7